MRRRQQPTRVDNGTANRGGGANPTPCKQGVQREEASRGKGAGEKGGGHDVGQVRFRVTGKSTLPVIRFAQQKVISKPPEGQAPCNQGPPASRAPRRAFHPDQTYSSESNKQTIWLNRIEPNRTNSGLRVFPV